MHIKLLLRVFDSWMRILKQVEGSVLWLLVKFNASATSNLKKEALARGVSVERLRFSLSKCLCLIILRGTAWLICFSTRTPVLLIRPQVMPYGQACLC